MYRGGPGMLAWALHRITGVAVLIFLLIHIIETMMIGFGPDAYNRAIAIYKQPWFKPFEFLLAAAVLYHAGNGILVMLVDFLPEATRVYRKLFWAGALVYTVLILPIAYFMLRPFFTAYF
jgi:succinate dehydrogenase / fumarate reductase cytochrome b subunit